MDHPDIGYFNVCCINAWSSGKEMLVQLISKATSNTVVQNLLIFIFNKWWEVVLSQRLVDNVSVGDLMCNPNIMGNTINRDAGSTEGF